MSVLSKTLNPEEEACYSSLNKENLDFLMNRCNSVTGWKMRVTYKDLFSG